MPLCPWAVPFTYMGQEGGRERSWVIFLLPLWRRLWQWIFTSWAGLCFWEFSGLTGIVTFPLPLAKCEGISPRYSLRESGRSPEGKPHKKCRPPPPYSGPPGVFNSQTRLDSAPEIHPITHQAPTGHQSQQLLPQESWPVFSIVPPPQFVLWLDSLLAFSSFSFLLLRGQEKWLPNAFFTFRAETGNPRQSTWKELVAEPSSPGKRCPIEIKCELHM